MKLLGYILAAVTPVLIFFIYKLLNKRKRLRTFAQKFWDRQIKQNLNKIDLERFDKIPEPYNFMPELESLQTTIQVVSLSIELGLFEHLLEKPGITNKQIAEFMKFSQRPVNALIEVLLAAEVIKTHQNGYALTDRARFYLLKDSPFFQSLPPPRIGKRFLRIAKNDKVKGAVNKWKKGKSSAPIRWALKQHEFSFPLGFALYNLGIIEGKNILDVAGGTGAVCIALAQSNPALNLKMIELPQSVGIAKKIITQYGLNDKIECIGMDMFNNDWPKNNTTILFTNIFHDWDDNKCRILSKKAYDALLPGGKILIQEALLHDDKAGPLWTAHWSMVMALMMEGKQFRFSQLKDILETAGFKNVKAQPLLGYYSTVNGVKQN